MYYLFIKLDFSLNWIYILFLVIFFKWLIYVIAIFPIRILSLRAKKRVSQKNVDKKNVNLEHSAIILKFRYLISGYIRYTIFQVGWIPCHFIRNFLYRHVYGVEMDRKVVIYWGAEIRSPYKLKIGKGSIIGDKALLDARNEIKIGENVNFSSNVHIYTEQHDHRDPWFTCNSGDTFRVVIGDRVWIGPNVIVLHSVTIGTGAVIAAGAVVTKDVEPFAIMAGIPARKIGERTHDLKYIFHGEHIPFY